ncbi:MAG: flagellin [Microbacteriaceae bacterium]|jgi:flagellin|nr:flagellin [Microbacteriaceae bacterium]HEV7956247.1 flagellin [Marisediminicola sp.]
MGMQINTNIAALNSYRNLSGTQNDLSKSLEKLSSGLRINRAADDAAGLAISEGLRSQIGGLTVAARNAQDGISVIQTVEGSLTEVHSILQRMRDLAVQAGNDSNSIEARTAIGDEALSLRDELSRIAESTNFNGIQLLDSTATLKFQVGADGASSSQINVDLSGANVDTVVAGINFGTTTGAQFTTATAINLGDMQTQFTQGSTVVTVAKPGAAYASTGAMATALNADKGFAQNFSASLDNQGKLVVTSKTSAGGPVTIAQDSTTPNTFVASAVTAGTPATAGFDSAAAAQASILLIDTQITAVSSARAELGAVQNRFESAINTLNVSKENISAAESRIRDTDMAEEMVNYTRANLLSQAGTAMLAQANQSNSGVLQLLR